MVSQVTYRTEAGDILAAKAEDAPKSGLDGLVADQVDVKIIRTAGGLDLLVATIAGKVGKQTGEPDPNWVLQIKNATFSSIQESILQDVPAILSETIRRSNQAIVSDPQLRGAGLTQVIIAIYGKRLYLAQVGNSRAYLIRNRRIVQITRDHTLASELMRLGKTLPAEISNSPRRNDLLRFIGKDNNIYVDTRINFPGAESKNHLDLQRGDGIVLSNNSTVERIMKEDRKEELGDGFFRLYDQQPPAAIAAELTETANRADPETGHPVVVMKSDEESASQSLPAAGRFWLGQIGMLAIVLIVSIGLGLIAAYAFPALMNPKPVPNTGAILAQPGFIMVMLADGQVSAQEPNQPPTSLSVGVMIEAKPGTQVRTAAGTAQLELSDGTVIYVDRSSSVIIQDTADPKARKMTNVIQIGGGGIMVDSSQTASGITTQVVTTEEGENFARGPFLGAQYDANKDDFEVDCLKGPCTIANSSASQNLATGQHSSIIKGTIGNISDVNWNRWDPLCDANCRLSLPASVPPTPTFVPTPVPGLATPVPYMGAFRINDLPRIDPPASVDAKISVTNLFPWALLVFGGFEVGLAGLKGLKSVRRRRR